MDFDASSAEPVTAVAEPAFDPKSAEPVAPEKKAYLPGEAMPGLSEEDRRMMADLNRTGRSDGGGSFAQKFVEPAARQTMEPAVHLPDVPDTPEGTPGVPFPGATTGVLRGLKSTAESLTAPIGAALAPLAGAASPIAKTITKAAEVYFAKQTAESTGEHAAKLWEKIQDPESTAADIAEEATNTFGSAAFTTALATHAAPKFSDHPVTFEAQTPDGKTIQVETTAGKLAEMVKSEEVAKARADEPPPKMLPTPFPEPAFDPASAKPVAAEFNPETAKPVEQPAAPIEAPKAPEVKFNVFPPEQHPDGRTIPGYVQIDEQANAQGAPMSDAQRAQYPSEAEILASGIGKGEHTLDEVNAAIEQKNKAEISDFGSPQSDTYGIANRVNEARAQSGDIAPVETGTSPGPEELVARGRQLLKEGETPDEAFARAQKFEDAGDRIGFVRAYGEQLYKKASDAADKFGTDSPEYAAAAKLDSDWAARIQPFKTELARGFHALQGETEIDTGTFHGIRRAFQDLSGRDFTPKEEVVANKFVTDQKAAQAAVEEIQPAFKKAIEDVVAPARKAVSGKILANLRDRYDAALARQKAKQGRLSAGLDPTDLRDYAEIAAYHIARGVEAGAELLKQFGEKIREHLPEILGAAKKIYSDAEKGELGNTVAGVYQRAKDYLDKGETNPSDVVAKIAADLGTTQADIWQKLATNKTVRTVTDETFRRMAERRTLTDAARNWVRDKSTPIAYRIATAPFRAGFRVATFGHGTVAPFTHAPTLGFNPGTFAIFWRNWARGFRLMGLKDAGAYHERMMQDLVRDPNYITFRRAGLENDPYRAATDYEKAWLGGWFQKIGAIGNRGFDSLKLIRQAYANRLWEKVPDSQRTPLMAQLIADSVNHGTGTLRRSYGPVTRAIFFAPRLIASQFAHLVGDSAKAAETVLKGASATPEAKAAAISHVKFLASVVGSYAAALAINQGLLSAANSKQKINFTDPHQSDWLKFKAIGFNVAPVSGPLAMVRLLGNLIRIEFGQLEGAEKRGGKGAALKDATLDFGRSKLSPTASILTDVVTGTDFQGRPLPFSKEKVPSYLRKEGVGKYTYTEYAFTHGPIPVSEAAREVWKKQGMDESTANHWIKALLMGLEAGTVGARITPDYKVEEKK